MCFIFSILSQSCAHHSVCVEWNNLYVIYVAVRHDRDEYWCLSTPAACIYSSMPYR